VIAPDLESVLGVTAEGIDPGLAIVLVGLAGDIALGPRIGRIVHDPVESLALRARRIDQGRHLRRKMIVQLPEIARRLGIVQPPSPRPNPP